MFGFPNVVAGSSFLSLPPPSSMGGRLDVASTTPGVGCLEAVRGRCSSVQERAGKCFCFLVLSSVEEMSTQI